jgi:putative heme iron utilization protein
MTNTNTIQAARALIDGASWLALATIGADGEAAVSYVPFALVEGGFGVAVSTLAAHTAHLVARPRISLLVVGDPTQDGDSFACPRVTIHAVAHAVTDPVQATAIWEALARRHGPTAEILRTLPDFHPFVLTPMRARVVFGFAQANDLDAEMLLPRSS